MTRKQVEEYFSEKNISFKQMCCVSVKQFSPGVYDSAYDDLVKIGQRQPSPLRTLRSQESM
jgi:hypothetical protein